MDDTESSIVSDIGKGMEKGGILYASSALGQGCARYMPKGTDVLPYHKVYYNKDKNAMVIRKQKRHDKWKIIVTIQKRKYLFLPIITFLIQHPLVRF